MDVEEQKKGIEPKNFWGMNKKSLIAISLIVIALIFGGILIYVSIDQGGFFKKTEQEKTSNIPYYFIAVHMEVYSPTREYPTLVEMVEKANEYNIKLTLMFTPQWADYISEDIEKLATLEKWKEQGHEISAHHHSIYHSSWDGYTDFSKEKVLEEMKDKPKSNPGYFGTLDDFSDHLKKINPDINSGCMNEEEDKLAMPDEIVYATCSGVANYGDSFFSLTDHDPKKGINEFVLVGEVSDIERKWLAHTRLTNMNEAERIKEVFNSMTEDVFGAVTHANAQGGEDVAFYDFLEFIHGQDSEGANSMTVSEIINSKILPEKEIDFDNYGNEESAYNNDIPYYVVIQHYDPVKQGGNATGRYNMAKKQVDYATEKNIKLSIWLGAGVVKHILESDSRIEDVKDWVEFGHEIGVHHHSIYKQHKSWDGYTSLPEDEAIKIRETYLNGKTPEEYLGTQEDYMDIFHDLEDALTEKGVSIEVKSGVNNEQFNKATSMPDEIIYSTGSGFINNGDPGRFIVDDSDISKAVNEFVTTGHVNGIERKWLSHYPIGPLDQEINAENKFKEVSAPNVFSAVCHNYEHEQESYYSFIDFLHEQDPDGQNSRTVTEVIELNILPERTVDMVCENNNGTICRRLSTLPGECDGEWLEVPDYPYNASGDYNCCLGNCIHENFEYKEECDLNSDGKIDPKESEMCGSATTKPINSDNSDCDLNGDGIIDNKELRKCR